MPMPTTSTSRFRATVRLAALAALLAGAASPGPASSGTAPVTPTFMLGWGGEGNAGGQFSTPSALATDAVGNLYVVDTNNHRVQKFDNRGHFLLRWGSLGSSPGQFNGPSGIAVSAAGEVFVVDRGNSKVKVFDGSTGSLLHQWGSPGTGSGQFNSPTGIATDAAGNVYVSDASNRVQKFAGDGTFLLQWGTTGSGAGEFDAPSGIGVGPGGNVYVADRLNDRIQVFTGAGAYVSQFGSIGAGAGQLDQPYGVGSDALGNVYVAELGNNRIQKFTSDGASLTSWGVLGSFQGAFDMPAGVALDAEGNVFVAEINNSRIQEFSGAGAYTPQVTPAFSANFGSYGSGNGQFNTPYGVAIDAQGWVYVADTWNRRVQKFSGNGVFSLKFGTQGNLPGQLELVDGIAVDAAGNTYVTSADNRVAKFSSAGTFLLQWGTTGTAAGQFSTPWGIAVDAPGNVYVVDASNSRVQKFSNTGSFLAQWGSSGSGSGQFTNPRGIAADRAGNVYVTDDNLRVQKFTSAGVFVTQWAIAGGASLTGSGITVDALGDVYVINGGPSSGVQKFTSEGLLLTQWGSYGSGNGQFAPGDAIAVDGTGNVYVADYGGNRIVKFVTPPAVQLVSDVGNDQGRQARLRIKGASVDAPANGGVTGYAVYRRVEPLPAAAAGAANAWAGQPTASDAVDLAGWDYLGTQPAAGDPEYSMVVPTLADASPALSYYTAFMVRALTPDPITHYDSVVEYGYSVDNLSPPAPTPFAATYTASATSLHWGPSSAADFATFRLYKGTSADFQPGAGSLVASTTDTSLVDAGPAGSWYKLSAVDMNGNESPFAVVGPQQTTAVDPQPRVAFALDGVRPNPASGRKVEVTFALPAALPAQLEMLDVMGRLVARREVGTLGAGPHVVDLAAGRSFAPGVYLVRLRQGASSRVKQVVIIP